MAQVANFTWDQGDDLTIELIYREGPTAETALVVDLSVNYALRMDVVNPSTKERLYTFNTAEIADVDPGAGTVPDNTLEGTLSSGAGGTPNISITVPRSLTLPGGALHAQMTAVPPLMSFNYDIFLRDTGVDKQVKILEGVITVKESNTLWL